MTRRRSLGDGLRMATGTLTALPVPPPRDIDRQVAAVAMLAAPLAAVLPGAAALALTWAAGLAGADRLLAAALGVAVVALGTRGLHLDGLADTADGLAASYDRDRALSVMRRGDTGPAGAATLVLVLLVQAAALAQALQRHGVAAALLGVVIGRLALPLACLRGIPAARPDGMGATVAGTVHRLAGSAVIVLVAAASAWSVGWPGPAAVVTAVLAAGILLARAVGRFGGITGDVLGAVVETATTAAWVALALR